VTSTDTVLAGRYRLVAPIGQGGMGRVWLATDELLVRQVAVKELVPPPGFTADEVREMNLRAMREARAAARLSHANVVAVYDVVVEGGAPWIVMEYVRSQSLHSLVAQQGPVDVSTAARIGLGVLAALRVAHRHGVLHRDVKPGNVLISDEGRVVLGDFGLATIIGDPAVTRSGMLIGSPSYLAPERATDGETGPATDLWSLGATLYYALEGHAPYERGSTIATIAALATEEPPPAPRAGPLAPVLTALLQRSPAARPAAAEVERRLRAALIPSPRLTPPRQVPREVPPDQVPAPALRRADPTDSFGPPPRRRLALTMVVAVVAVVALITAGLIAWTIASGPDPDDPRTAAAPTATSISTVDGLPTPAESTSQPTVSPSAPGDGAPALPAGWHTYVDPTGFSVAVPTDWQVSRVGTIVYFREPSGGRYLGIDQTDQPQPDPVADWTGKESYRVSRGDFPGYQRIRLEEVAYFDKAADWEFSYLVDGGRVHVLNRGFITAPNRAYGMWWSTPDDQWERSLTDLELVQRTFTPAG
jgi:serine/threonine protein kinase